MIIQTSPKTKGISISCILSYNDYLAGLKYCEDKIKNKKIEAIKAFMETGWSFLDEYEYFVDIVSPEREIKDLKDFTGQDCHYYYTIYGITK